jgi:hypothetical protein
MEKPQHSIFLFESLEAERDAHYSEHYKTDIAIHRLHQPFDYTVVRVYRPTSTESGLVETLGHSFVPHIRDQYAFRYKSEHPDITDYRSQSNEHIFK